MNKLISELAEKIEVLRDQMHRQAKKTGIAHPDVFRLSCELDKLIVRYQAYTRRTKANRFREKA